MKFHVCTLFPEMIEQGCNTSILGRAKEKGLIEVGTTNIRDFSTNKHMKVDDYPYGGGAGMVMQAEPVYQACEYAKRLMGGSARVIYLTPQGKTFDQKMAQDFAQEENLIFLCGHYEGIDERVLEEVVTDYVSIGDYVLTGGELASLVMIDAIARLVPDVLHNDVSADIETFYDDLLEYPQYSRPAIWHDKEVPEVLLSGHHARIEAWRYEQSVARTAKWRPDLLEKHQKRKSEEQQRKKKKQSKGNFKK